MADRGRDLKIAVISDADKFDLSDPADELKNLGQAAEDAADKIDKSSTDIKQAGTDIEKFGSDADATATKVDSAFEKIAASSRSNLRKVDSEADKAKKGLDDFKSEAGQSGREAAASFTGGFDGITDFVQETAANAFGGFGKLGAAAGVAAAVGIGVLVSEIQAAQQRLSELRDLFFEFGKDPGKGPGERIKEIAEELGPDRLKDISDALRTTGVDSKDFFAALSGDAGAAKEVKDALDGMIPAFNLPWDQKANEAQHLSHILGEYKTSASDSKDATKLYNDVLGETPEKAKAAADAIAENKKSVDDASEAVKALAEDTSFEQFAENAKISVKDVIKTLDEQTKAAEEFRDNLLEVQKRGDDEFLAWVSKQPAAVAAAYSDGTAKQKQSIYDAYRRNVGAQQALGTAQGLTDQKGRVAAAAGGVYTAIKSELTGETIYVPVGFNVPSAGEAYAVRERMRRLLAQPINIPITYQDVGNVRKYP